MSMSKLVSLSEAIAQNVRDGDLVYAAGFTHLIPFAAGHEIIRQGQRDLTLARATPDLIYDQMVAAGCAKKIIFSYSGNPGVGGFGAILRTPNKELEVSGCEGHTTNNRMELMGVIRAIEALKTPCRVRVTTDSTYVVKGMTEWIAGWQKNNWRNSQKKAVLNQDLWQRLLQAAAPHEIEWIWIKGHTGHPENERCDTLAAAEIKACKAAVKARHLTKHHAGQGGL